MRELAKVENFIPEYISMSNLVARWADFQLIFSRLDPNLQVILRNDLPFLRSILGVFIFRGAGEIGESGETNETLQLYLQVIQEVGLKQERGLIHNIGILRDTVAHYRDYFSEFLTSSFSDQEHIDLIDTSAYEEKRLIATGILLGFAPDSVLAYAADRTLPRGLSATDAIITLLYPLAGDSRLSAAERAILEPFWRNNRAIDYSHEQKEAVRNILLRHFPKLGAQTLDFLCETQTVTLPSGAEFVAPLKLSDRDQAYCTHIRKGWELLGIEAWIAEVSAR